MTSTIIHTIGTPFVGSRMPNLSPKTNSTDGYVLPGVPGLDVGPELPSNDIADMYSGNSVLGRNLPMNHHSFGEFGSDFKDLFIGKF